MIRIRKALPSDARELSRISKACLADHWSEEAFLSHLEGADSIILVAEDTCTAGFICASKEEETLYIESIAVSTECRRQGTGAQLVHALHQMHPECEIVLDVRTSNSSAISFYEHLGFERLCIRKRMYSSPAEDGITMKMKYLHR